MVAKKTPQQMGGEARSEAMTSKQRKSLATKAAHARWKKSPPGIAEATHEGEVKIGAFTIPCAVLKDGRRIFTERGLSDAFEHVRSGAEFKKRSAQPEAAQLPVFISEAVAVHLPDEARAKLAKPIRFKHAGGGIPARGVEADVLAEICDAYLSARAAGELQSPAAERRAAAAERLMRALAKVAIVALIDEATGYQVERDKEALQKLLEQYISEEYRPWLKTFPTEFYVQLFRLRGIKTDDVRKRPAYFGHLTNNVVYDRLLPGTLQRLAEVNPDRSHKHHQNFSTEGVGLLRQHLSNVIFMMKGCKTWKEFHERLDLAAPRRGDAPAASAQEEDDAD